VSDTPAAGIVPVSGPPAVRVLVVDDDGAICVAYDEVLRAHQYEVSTAGSRAEALREIARLNGGVDVLILDIALPDADGADLAREITGQIGQRPTLYVSGWTDEFWDLTAAPGRWLVLQKPIPIPRLIEAVDWLSGRRAARPDGA
jgi:DNA-binding response OmpR family regulator